MLSTRRSIFWLGPGWHSVDHYISLGRQTVQVAINHYALNWGTVSGLNVNLYNAASPNLFFWPEIFVGDRLPPAPLRRDLRFLYELDQSSRPVPFMTDSDLVNWWCREIPPDSMSQSDFRAKLSDPAFLIKWGYNKIRNDYFWVSEEVTELAACLSMIGVGAIELMLSSCCDLCGLRRSAPSLSRCDQCSQSKKLIEPSAIAIQSRNSGRNRRVRDRGSIPPASPLTDIYESFSRSICSLLFRWRDDAYFYPEWLDKVSTSLESAPLVYGTLPANFLDFGGGEKLRALRVSIDRNEWDYLAWPDKILRAQESLATAASLSARRRTGGPLRATMELALRARTLIREGLTHREVASRLSISRSHLSHVLKRTSNLDAN